MADAGVFAGVAVAPALAAGFAAAPPALSKYLSNAAFAFPGGPNGVALALASVFSFLAPILSLLAERAR